MLNFTKVNTLQDIEAMSRLATAIMKRHYDPIVGEEVNNHMLERYQSVHGITAEIEGGAEYYFVKNGIESIGFIAVDVKKEYLYLSKFYLDSTFRGKGYSSEMMAFVKDYARTHSRSEVLLNVNADNKNTVEVYKHFGFEIIEEYQRDVGSGYAVHDYVMKYVE